MPKTDPTYQVSRDALMKHFARGLNYDDDLVAGIYSVKKIHYNWDVSSMIYLIIKVWGIKNETH